MATFAPSAQQIAFYDFLKNSTGSCCLIAVAGAGKTTSLVGGIENIDPSLEIAMMAYNKAIVEEITPKVAKFPNVTPGTAHSFGFKAIIRHVKGVKVYARKVSELVEATIPEKLTNYQEQVCKLVSYAKQRALGVIGSIEDDSAWYDIGRHFDVFQNGDTPFPEAEVVRFAKHILNESNKVVKTIDFDDMIYLPILLGFRVQRFDVVMVDEAQDTNPARRALVRAMLKPSGRVVAVGDPHQAIYGFTGADNDSLDLIKKDFNAVELPLTVSYRCPKAIVKFASQWVSHIAAADTAPEGNVSKEHMAGFMGKAKDMNGDSVILCRNTAPLLKVAFKLIGQKIGCKVEGRDIGASLKKLATRWKCKNTDELLSKLEVYAETEKTKYLAKKNEMKAQAVDDQVQALIVIIENVNALGKHTVKDVCSSIDTMFEDDGSKKGLLTLSTIHKSKGREWKNVYWLNRETTCPSKYARQEWQMDQEENLMYVAATRSKANLVDLIGE